MLAHISAYAVLAALLLRSALTSPVREAVTDHGIATNTSNPLLSPTPAIDGTLNDIEPSTVIPEHLKFPDLASKTTDGAFSVITIIPGPKSTWKKHYKCIQKAGLNLEYSPPKPV